MNAGMARVHESHFGPPSEHIDVAKFIQSVIDAECRNSTAYSVLSSGDSIPCEETSRQLDTAQSQSVASEYRYELTHPSSVLLLKLNALEQRIGHKSLTL
jgi:hypothetical protein